ncbi:MAG: SRPBCC domain-containing protein [Vicinamibacterales bacterium]
MKFSRSVVVLCLAGMWLSAPPALAQVSGTGFRSRVQLDIRATPAKVFESLLQVGRWWHPDHTYSGDASNLSLDPRPGGCFCERLPNGGGVEHLRLVYLAPGEMLRMTGALGPLQGLGVTGSLTIALKPTFGGTTAELVYAVGGFSEAGFTQLAPAVQGVLTEQMNRLKAYVETGRPTR